MSTEETQQEPVEQIEAAPEVVVDTPTPEAAPSADGKPVVETAAPAFVPDFKYKFKNEEREIDPLFRPLIKDAETLKKVKELAERSDSTEMHKGLSKEYQEKISTYEPIVQEVQRYQQMFQAAEAAKDPGAHRKVLTELGYSNNLLKDVVRDIIKEEQLPDEQKRMLEQNRAAHLEKEALMSENSEIVTKYNDVLRDITAQGMELEFGKTTNQQLVQAYEAANGNGSFRQLFLERGAYWVSTEGRHVPPSEVMARIAKEFAPFITTQVAGAPVSQIPQQPTTVIRAKPKTMPQVGSGSGNPTKQSISSLADLKAKYDQLTQQQD